MSGGSNTSAPGEAVNTSAAGEPENTSEGQGAAHDSTPEIDPTLRKSIHDEGFDNGIGKGRGLANKEWAKALGVRDLDEALQRLAKADAKAAEVAEKAKQERATKSAVEDELSKALADVKELQAANSEFEQRLATYEARAERALLDRVSAAAANHGEHRVVPGAMDLFVAAVRDRVQWNDDGTDVVVLSKTAGTGTTYVDKTKTLADLVAEVYEERPFLFESSGRKGAGSELGPVTDNAPNPFAPGGESFRDRMMRMRQH